jgi:hypothetical protein
VTWRDGALAYSDWRAVDPTTKPDQLLEPLAGPPEVVVAPPPTPKPLKLVKGGTHDERAWYQRRWVQASILGGVVASVVTVYVLAHQPRYVTAEAKTMWPPP